MRTSKTGWLLLAFATIGATAAEEITVPIDGVSGAYDVNTPPRVVDIDLGFALYRIDSVRMTWSGELTACWGTLWGSGCTNLSLPLPASFSAATLEPVAFAFAPRSEDYPNSESFSSEDAFQLFSGNTWTPLLDGQFSLRLLFFMDFGTFCNVTVLEEVSGVLDSAELIIEGVRAGDLDADGDVDTADRASFLPCHSGIGVPYASGCGAADFDRDGDVDCGDWDRFEAAWTTGGSPAPFSACQYAVLEVTPTALLWSPVEQATAYDVVVGDLRALRDTGGDFVQAVDGCVANDEPLGSLLFGGQPLQGEGLWFLVRAVSDAGAMTYDSLYPSQVNPRDDAINASALACP